MTQGNLNATQTSANEQTKNVWAHARACIPLSCVCMGKKGGALSGCMRYFCWASHIEQTNNLFQLKQAADPVSAERGLCSIGSHHPFNQKKPPNLSNTGWLWPGGQPWSFRSRYSVKHGDARREWRARSIRVPKKTHQWKRLRRKVGEGVAGVEALTACGGGEWGEGKLIMWLRLIRWC